MRFNMIQQFSVEASWLWVCGHSVVVDICWYLWAEASHVHPQTLQQLLYRPWEAGHWKPSPHWFQARQINGRWTRLTVAMIDASKTVKINHTKALAPEHFYNKNLHTQQFLDSSTYQPHLALLVLDRLVWICFLVSINQLNIHPWRSWTARASEQSKDWRPTSTSWPTFEVTIGFTIRSWRMTIIQGSSPQNWPKVSFPLFLCKRHFNLYLYI